MVAALGAPHCAPASRDAALSVVESLLDHRQDALNSPAAAAVVGAAASEGQQEAAEGAPAADVLAPHAGALLAALRAVVLSATGSGGGRVSLFECFLVVLEKDLHRKYC